MAYTSESRSTVFFMVLSAGIFAYFGFATSWAHQYTSANAPQPNALLPMVVVLKWSLRGGAIAFGVAAALSIAGTMLGALLYSLAGLITAALFAVVGVWEVTNPQGYYSGVPAILLFVFAAWNGYGAWMGLQEILGRRAAAIDQSTIAPPGSPPVAS